MTLPNGKDYHRSQASLEMLVPAPITNFQSHQSTILYNCPANFTSLDLEPG
jgi:hypothetical protein